MSVIAKLNVSAVRPFADGQLIELSCVCENQFMAQYHPENEDVVFTKASPWGEARVQMKSPLELMDGDQVYVVFTRSKDVGGVHGAIAWCEVRIASITDFGGESRRVEIMNGYRAYDAKVQPDEISAFNLRMSIDNPGAYRQFRPGEGAWWAMIYRCRDVTIDEALALAHRAAEPAEVVEDSGAAASV
jgi:hypothetical protein